MPGVPPGGTSSEKSLRYKCDTSLNPRTIIWSPCTTSREIDPFAAPLKANPFAPVAIARAAPTTPP